MTDHWQETIRDPKERKVFEALADPAWDFRTVHGISKSTGLLESEVAAILEKYPNLIRESVVPDGEGHELFTLRSRPRNRQEILAELRMFVTKSVR